jgi:hypothetical protein
MLRMGLVHDEAMKLAIEGQNYGWLFGFCVESLIERCSANVAGAG